MTGTVGSVRGATLIWVNHNATLEIQKGRTSSFIYVSFKTITEMFSIQKNCYLQTERTASALLREHATCKQSSSWWHWTALPTSEKKLSLFSHIQWMQMNHFLREVILVFISSRGFIWATRSLKMILCWTCQVSHIWNLPAARITHKTNASHHRAIFINKTSLSLFN